VPIFTTQSLRAIAARAQELRRLRPLFADRMRDGDKVIASRSDVAMSGLADCGRETGHGNIDANDPVLTRGHLSLAHNRCNGLTFEGIAYDLEEGLFPTNREIDVRRRH
jgi:hypothetical protein